MRWAIDLFSFCSYYAGMQYTLPLVPLDRIAGVHRSLLAAFGPPPGFVRLDPVSQMILAMLSARTRNQVALGVFAALVEHFEVAAHEGRWTRLAQAAFHEIDPLLEGITHPARKAVALPRALRQIAGLRGQISLDFLAGWPVGPALAWLERIYGVGPKTSTATLNLSTLQKRVLVVDTAHWRAALCLGLIPAGTTPERSARLLNRQTPDAWEAADMEAHHILMQRLGQAFCSRGGSGSCPFRAVCGGRAAAAHRRQRLLDEWLEESRPRQPALPTRRTMSPVRALEENPVPFHQEAMDAPPAAAAF